MGRQESPGPGPGGYVDDWQARQMARRRQGAKLRQRRKEFGLNQAQLAAAVGVHPSAVSHWEAGRFPVPPDQLANLARALGCKPEDIST